MMHPLRISDRRDFALTCCGREVARFLVEGDQLFGERLSKAGQWVLLEPEVLGTSGRPITPRSRRQSSALKAREALLKDPGNVEIELQKDGETLERVWAGSKEAAARVEELDRISGTPERARGVHRFKVVCPVCEQSRGEWSEPRLRGLIDALVASDVHEWPLTGVASALNRQQ